MIEWLHFHFSLFMHWRRKWQPTPVFLPGESQGWWSHLKCMSTPKEDPPRIFHKSQEEIFSDKKSHSLTLSETLRKARPLGQNHFNIIFLMFPYSVNQCPQVFVWSVCLFVLIKRA